jgi:hypothetical protein
MGETRLEECLRTGLSLDLDADRELRLQAP